MPKSKEVDAYIAKSAEFARPILTKIRELFHKGCPEVEETMKWSVPFFEYRGIIGSMAAFKAHATFGFWKSSLVVGEREKDSGMGQFGRIQSLADLPPRAELEKMVKKAMARRQRRGAAHLRGLPAELPARICPVDRRGQAARDAGPAARPGGRVDGRG